MPTTDPGWLDGAPTSGESEHCAMCGDEPVAWVHPFTEDARTYRLFGKGYTLPHYWMLCEWCESVCADGDDEGLLRIMRSWQASNLDDGDDRSDTFGRRWRPSAGLTEVRAA